MIFDRTLLFSNAQAVTASAPSTDQLDIGTVGTAFGAAAPLIRDIGKGGNIPVLIQVVEAFNNLTSLKVSVQTSDDATFSTGVTDVQEQTIAAARLTVGRQSTINIVPPGVSGRYLRIFYTVTGTAPTTGRITAGVVADVQTSGVSY